MNEDHLKAPPAPALDAILYTLDSEQRDFLKRVTRINDDEELKRHILEVQGDAYKVFPYPCIRYFTFANKRATFSTRDCRWRIRYVEIAIAQLPNYQQILKLPQDRPGAILLYIGCCFGSDLRKAVFDGWPVRDAIASDLFTGTYLVSGALHLELTLQSQVYGSTVRLYRTTQETFPAGFVGGNAFDDKITSLQEPLSLALPPDTRPKSLISLKSLNPLRGRVAAIHASLFFHLFDEKKQLELARRLVVLLSPEPGSVIFGGHYGRMEKGLKTEILGNGREYTQFWHSPDSWKDVWSRGVFKDGKVKIEVDWF